MYAASVEPLWQLPQLVLDARCLVWLPVVRPDVTVPVIELFLN